MIYLNNKLKDIRVEDFVINLFVKSNNFNDFLEKQFRFAIMDENLNALDFPHKYKF